MNGINWKVGDNGLNEHLVHCVKKVTDKYETTVIDRLTDDLQSNGD